MRKYMYVSVFSIIHRKLRFTFHIYINIKRKIGIQQPVSHVDRGVRINKEKALVSSIDKIALDGI